MQLIRRLLAFLFSMSLTFATGLGLVRAAGDATGQKIDMRVQDGKGNQAAPSENRSDLHTAGAIRRIVHLR